MHRLEVLIMELHSCLYGIVVCVCVCVCVCVFVYWMLLSNQIFEHEVEWVEV